ncbi:cytochrome P450 [Antrihabitans stalactiti]|uniref:cytochrome P450 n=1 Tax=Antrihabitans stalactiti TaxID=2584121 RepID=UPI00146DB8B2
MNTIDDVPTAPGRLPLVGHGISVLRRPLDFVTMLPPYGPIVRIFLGPRTAYVLTTPDLIRQVGLGEAGSFHRDELRDAIKELSTGAVNVLSGQAHELRRRMIAPSFKQGRLAEYGVVAARLGNEWAQSFHDGEMVNVVESAHDLVLRTISSTLFTADFSSNAHDDIQSSIPWLLNEVIRRASLPPGVRPVRVLANRKFVKRSRQLRASIGDVVSEYRKSGADYNDMLSAFIAHVDPETGTRLSDNDIVDELILILGAGVGSEASMFAWLVHEVVTHPEVAQRLYAELDTVVPDKTIGPEHVGQLVYFRQVLQETLRFWAPWVSMLTAAGDVTVGGLTLPDGAIIVFSPYMIQHDERYFPNAASFDPDRWGPDRVSEIDKRHSLPFGVGERRCPGNHFAMLAITLQAGAFLARWRPVPDPDYRVKPTNRDFTASPSKLPVRLHAR